MTGALRRRDRILQHYLRAGNHPLKLRMEGWLRACMGISAHQVRCSTRWGTIMEVDPVEWVQREILYTGCYEPKTTELILSLLKAGDTFLDVGAHVGYYSLLAANQVGAKGRVISVEPNPRTFMGLRNNLRLNPSIQNVNAILSAASNAMGLVEMSWPPDGNWGVSKITTQDTAAYTIPCVDLSAILEHLKISKVAVAKLDIENHERMAMEGLCHTIKPGHIIFESNPGTIEPVNGITKFLEDQGYSIFNINGEPCAPKQEIPENNLWARRSVNNTA